MAAVNEILNRNSILPDIVHSSTEFYTLQNWNIHINNQDMERSFSDREKGSCHFL